VHSCASLIKIKFTSKNPLIAVQGVLEMVFKDDCA
jgi:hypothetical protein